MNLKTENLSLMTDEQASFVRSQWEAHQHPDTSVDFDISGFGDRILREFQIQRGVWDPFKASGGRHARFLANNTRLFWNKNVLEIGSGTGLLGIVMALCGAKRVIMSDISERAVRNTEDNVNRFVVNSICDVRKSDLFEQVPETFDMILWNIPFFPGHPPEGDTISASMIMPPVLLRRFLSESRHHLKEGGAIVVPSYSFGGESMDPLSVGTSLGFKGERTWIYESRRGIQQGQLYITELHV
ncbi:MAG: class I SAM-dependent methyltransferase [Candidatus Moranbacteria bacterium]|nr:class I SAM-dependent methyltransferase [Candidatus Moranbacteria bacterium]